MAVGPTPDEIFDRAVEEGRRRLDQSVLELVSTSFIAGSTVVFGLVGLDLVAGAFPPRAADGPATVATESAGRELVASFARAISSASSSRSGRSNTSS